MTLKQWAQRDTIEEMKTPKPIQKTTNRMSQVCHIAVIGKQRKKKSGV
jgi:hypothetical protein